MRTAAIRKYREIGRLYMKMQLAWRADIIVGMLFTISKILFAYLLWGIVFRERETVAGFTFHSMLTYYLISSFLSQMEMSGGISGEISARIRNGTFSKYMVLPINIEGYFAAMEVGAMAFCLVYNLIAAFSWVVIFRIRFVLTASGLMIAGALAMAALGMFFMVQLNFFLGILTLKYEEISTFLMIKDNLIALVQGSIVPLALFPETAVGIMRLLPFYYVTYLPSMLLTGRCGEEMAIGMVILGLWCGGLQIMISLVWRKYRRKYDGVGI